MVFKSTSKNKATKKVEKKAEKKAEETAPKKTPVEYYTTYTCGKCGAVATEGPSVMYFKAICPRCSIRMSVKFKKVGD